MYIYIYIQACTSVGIACPLCIQDIKKQPSVKFENDQKCKVEDSCDPVLPAREPPSPCATVDAYMIVDSDEEMPAAGSVT